MFGDEAYVQLADTLASKYMAFYLELATAKMLTFVL